MASVVRLSTRRNRRWLKPMNVSEQISTVAADKQVQLEGLHSSLSSFLAAADVPEETEKTSLREECWSILQIAEHVAVVEAGGLERLLERESNPGPPDYALDRYVAAAALDRSKPRIAPERVHPAGRFGTLAEACAELKNRRQETIAFIESNTEDLRTKWVNHPLTDMDGHQLILFLSNHLLRHAAQIEEIKNCPAYKAALEKAS